MQRERISWIPLVVCFVFVGICSVLVLPRKSEALPQFARRYNLKCTACHTIVPVLNERMRQRKPWLTMVDTRVKVSGFVRPRRLG